MTTLHHPDESRSNTVRDEAAQFEPRSLRTFTPTQAGSYRWVAATFGSTNAAFKPGDSTHASTSILAPAAGSSVNNLVFRSSTRSKRPSGMWKNS